MKLKKLKAISYWVRKLSNQGNDDPDINTLDNVTLHDLVVEMNAKEEDKERDSLDLKPKDFDAKDFDDWSKSFLSVQRILMTGQRVLLSIWTRLQEEQAHHCVMLSGQRMLMYLRMMAFLLSILITLTKTAYI